MAARFFAALATEPPGVRAALQEALGALAGAYAGCTGAPSSPRSPSPEGAGREPGLYAGCAGALLAAMWKSIRGWARWLARAAPERHACRRTLHCPTQDQDHGQG